MATEKTGPQSRKGRRVGPARRTRKGDTRQRPVKIIRQVWDAATNAWRHERIEVQ